MSKILIINDTPIVNKVLKRSIESGDGISVDTVETGNEGIDAVKNGAYDLILLDFKLPDVNGDVVCKSIKEDEKTNSIPVYFISSMEKGKMDEVIQETNAQGYLDITMDSDALVEQIIALVGNT